MRGTKPGGKKTMGGSRTSHKGEGRTNLSCGGRISTKNANEPVIFGDTVPVRERNGGSRLERREGKKGRWKRRIISKGKKNKNRKEIRERKRMIAK